ncbi:MAG: hypothetical protein JXR80_07970 [Deltaproteobacteria bacterium]|nr:hypothetical protein [Deltaproteobacteria bacterium]
MCNPRKVMIHVARSIEEAWEKTISECASCSEEVGQLASLTADIELDREMGEAALVMLEKVLAGDFPGHPAWGRNQAGDFVKEMEAISLCYQPSSRQLTMTAHLSGMASAEAESVAQVSGVTRGEIAFDAIGHYYEDGWKDRTEEKALAEAREQAEIRLARALYELNQAQQQETIGQKRDALQEKAQNQARKKLAESKKNVRVALRRQLQAELTARRQEAFYAINLAVGEAYRQTLCKLVLDSGGRIISDRQSGSVIDLELEI